MDCEDLVPGALTRFGADSRRNDAAHHSPYTGGLKVGAGLDQVTDSGLNPVRRRSPLFRIKPLTTADDLPTSCPPETDEAAQAVSRKRITWIF